MNVIDSSGWIEYFTDGVNADIFAPVIEDTSELIVPVICIYEVFKCILIQRGLAAAQTYISDMYSGKVVDLDTPLAITAANLSVEYTLPMADSMILATSRHFHARLWTQDAHFQGIEGVEFVPAIKNN